MSKFLVTGGAGFIGSHIVAELVKKNHFVRVLDNFSSGKRENLNFIYELKNLRMVRQAHHPSNHPERSRGAYELIEADIRDYSICQKACKGIDFVLHQAALRSVPKSMLNPKEYNEVNINGTLNMLQASLKNKVKCFVFASSSSVYGDINKFPEKENFLPQPISPYALTKLTGEHYCKIFSQHYGLSTVCLRYFNVFGPRQALDDEYAVVIPKFITCILKNEHPPIYGTGKQSRDFTYVSNVVQANILAAKKANLSPRLRRGIPPFAGKGGVFNIAAGKDYTILELVRILNKLMNKDIKPVFLSPRAGDVFRTLADLSKSKSILAFKPKIDFIKGLELTINSHT